MIAMGFLKTKSHNMNIEKDIITLDSGKPGKTVTVIAGIHGNEICGLFAFSQIIPKLKITAGKVHFVYGNLRAIERNQRQIDVNLNRIFKPDEELTEEEKKSYEYKEAQRIKKVLDESDALLDLHSSRNKESVPFAIVGAQSVEIAQKMPFTFISTGWDIVEPGGTDDYMNRQKKINICAECGYNLDPAAVDTAKAMILTFLASLGSINKDIVPYRGDQTLIHAYYIYHTKTNNFQLAKVFSDFEKVTKGSVIGVDDAVEVRAPEDSYIVFALNRDTVGAEAFVLCKDMR